MQGYDISDLRTKLQSVRGETRVKTKEESIRNEFLQDAVDEVFTDHDWPFNKRTVDVTTLTLTDGRYEAPADFSMFNDYYIGTKDGKTISQTKDAIVVEQEEEKTWLTFSSTPQHLFNYYIKAPDLLNSSAVKVYFPQAILLAERAYVRLKTAYFPDEESDKEYARNRRALRELFVKSVPKKSFTTSRWG